MPAPTDLPLLESDPEIARLIVEENRLENDKLRLIASENYASRAVMEATGSVLTNKYSEGYAHKRYYEGQQAVDQVEELAIARQTLRPRRVVRRRARERPAVLGQPGQPRGVPGVLQRGRHHHGPGAAGRRAPDARPHACRSRASTSRACSTACEGGPPHRPRRGAGPRARAPAQSSSGAVRRRTLARSTSLRSAPSPTRSGRSSSSTSRTSLGWSARACIRRRRHRRRHHVHDAQDVPRPARRHDPLQEGACGGDRQAPYSRGCRAVRTTT